VQLLGQGSTATKLQLLRDLGYRVEDAQVEGPGLSGRVQLAGLLTHDTPAMQRNACLLRSEMEKGICGSLIKNKLVPSSP
jgi:hypothetical protein